LNRHAQVQKRQTLGARGNSVAEIVGRAGERNANAASAAGSAETEYGMPY
jgi:hypothetical protein